MTALQTPEQAARAKLFAAQQKLRAELTEERVPKISPKTFRAAVEAIENPDQRYTVQFYYLLAARLSEATNKTYEADLLKGASRPYGSFLKIEIVNFEKAPKEFVKTWLFTLAIAKRGLKVTKKKRKAAEELDEPIVSTQEIEKALITYNQLELLAKWKKGETTIDPLLAAVWLGRVRTKTVALPLSIEYEPWTFDMLKYLTKKHNGTLPATIPFNQSRQQLRFTIREALKSIMPPCSSHACKNILRHWRISHLLDYYAFDPAEMTIFTGWTPQTAFAQQGAVGGSSNLDDYYHGQWRKYYPKLLRPITEIAN